MTDGGNVPLSDYPKALGSSTAKYRRDTRIGTHLYTELTCACSSSLVAQRVSFLR